jgi:hypothetical protein
MRPVAGSGVIGSARPIGSSGTHLEMCVPDPMDLGTDPPGTRWGYPMSFPLKTRGSGRSRADRVPATR